MTADVCARCSAAILPGQRFCGSCGATIAAVCPACGTTSPPTFSFCGSCGADLQRRAAPPPRPGDERRVVTVLFADLAGFTARAERLDPEEVRAILQAYYGRLRREIEAFGGTVEKFIGDAVMAVFGVPVAHGDDPERGVRAGLAIRDAIAAMNSADAELDLQVRIAINTGEAIVALGAKPVEGEGMVAGDVVNTASRLQTTAPRGAILVGEETHRCTHDAIDYSEVAPQVLKGKEVPVRAWLALRASVSPGERRMRSAALVGRQRELTALDSVWEATTATRRAHLVTVIGEAGIGKSRLATELCGRLTDRGAQALQGRVLPYGTSTPYGPFSQIVKNLSGIFASDTTQIAVDKLRAMLAQRLDGAGEVAAHLEMLVGLGSGGEVADRRILFFSARRFVEALAREQPTVMVFEDIHWADDGMLDLVETLGARVRDAPLLVVALSRPELLSTRPGWGGGIPDYTALRLTPLEDSDARELASRLLAEIGDAESAAAGEALVARAEGNPLFIEEIAAALLERSSTAPSELPTTVRGILAARLDALPHGDRALLLDASVVGRTFWRGALERMSGNGSSVSAALDSLEARDLINREARSWIENDEQFTFKHALVRDVAYATVPRAQRRERHAQVATFLETATTGAGATATALAAHWREAGNQARAVDYLLMAADQAGRGWAKEEAAHLYREALELIPAEDVDRRREIARRRALALQAVMHLADARYLADRGDPDGRRGARPARD